jgi:hypothetical protein
VSTCRMERTPFSEWTGVPLARCAAAKRAVQADVKNMMRVWRVDRKLGDCGRWKIAGDCGCFVRWLLVKQGCVRFQ